MRVIRMLAALMLLAIVIAACGGDDDDPTATALPATQPPATATAAVTAAATATAPVEPATPTVALQPTATATASATPTATPTRELSATATVVPTPTPSPTPQPTPVQDPVVYHDIIFGDLQEDRGGQYPEGIAGIWAIDADGSDLHAITHTPEGWGDTWPAVSPDGTRVAFIRSTGGLTAEYGGEGAIYIVDIASGDEVWIADGRAWMSWSPDGARLLMQWQEHSFGLACCGGGREFDDPAKIAMVAADGSNFWVLAEPTYVTGEGGTIPGGATWSPDGSQILYVRSTYESRPYDDGTEYGEYMSSTLVVVDADGSNPREINLSGVQPWGGTRWSPDGETIVFSGADAGGNSGLFAIAPDGSGLRRLTPPNLAGWEFEFTPDGLGVAFPGIGGTSPLFVVNLDGSGLTQVTPPGVTVNNFAYSPNGLRIAFRDGNGTLQVMNADGTGLVTFAEQQLFWTMAWSPDSTRLVYLTYPNGYANELRVADIRTMTVTPPLALVRYGEGVISPVWRPTGD